MSMREKRRHVVAATTELPPGSRIVVSIDGREIGVFNVGGEYHALLNRCPHRAAPLCHGKVRPLVVATGVGQIDYEREGEVLKCPWHMWEFDIRTGRALFDDRLAVRTYQVATEDDQVVLYL